MAHELNIGTISGYSASELIEQLAASLVENGIGSSGGNDLILSSPTLGNYVYLGGHAWRVCHINSSAGEVYLIHDTILEDVKFGVNNVYSGSNLAAKCNEFYNNLPNNVQNILLMKTVNGVTAKVFVPSLQQVKGGFNLFNSNANRIAYNSSGEACFWWTSSISSTTNFVNTVVFDGSTDHNSCTDTCGFRPCLAIARSAFS